MIKIRKYQIRKKLKKALTDEVFRKIITLHWQCDSHTPPGIVPLESQAHFVQLGPLNPAPHSMHFLPAKPGLQVHAPPIVAQVPTVPIGLHSHGIHGSFTLGDTPYGR